MKLPGSYFTGSGSCGITVTQSHVTIRGRGAGAGGTLIDCAQRSRHFIILGDNVTLVGLSLVNGSARARACGPATPCTFAADGGCVVLAGRSAFLSGCALTNCFADGRGGALFVAQGPVRLSTVHIFGCQATYGGALWVGAPTALSAETSLSSCAAYRGGGVFVQGSGGSLTATRTAVFECQAKDAGGAIYANLNASIRLQDVLVQANGAGANGGGVCIVEGGTLQVGGDSTVEDNTVRALSGRILSL